jgi:hypothetical protein
MAGQLINQKSAREFQEKLEEEIEHGPRSMALIGQLEKTGKASLGSNPDLRSAFPVLAILLGFPMLTSLCQNSARQSK